MRASRWLFSYALHINNGKLGMQNADKVLTITFTYIAEIQIENVLKTPLQRMNIKDHLICFWNAHVRLKNYILMIYS